MGGNMNSRLCTGTLAALVIGSLATPGEAQLTAVREISVANAGPVSQLNSPLLVEQNKILSAPSPVRYYILKRLAPKFRGEYADFLNIPKAKMDDVLSDMYYTRALSIASKLEMDQSCAEILNRYGAGADARSVALAWEAQYAKVFGSLPDIVPVDTDSVTSRLIEQDRIR
jgi:hypothetical protein